MARPLEIGTSATARDVAALSRVLMRVTKEEGRDPQERKKIGDHLRSAIGLLIRWTEEEPRARANGHRKEKSEGKIGLRAVR